jgi:hypothetical protein
MGPVPGRNPGHHPQRLAQRQRERAGHVGADDLPDGQVSPVGGLPQQPGDGQHLEAGEPARAARLGREQRGDLLPAPLHDVSGAQEHGLLGRGRQFGPAREGRGGRVDREGRVGPGPGRDPGHDGAAVRIEIVEQPT